MRLQTREQNRGSTHSPSRTASPGSPDRRPRGPEGPPRPAIRSGRQRADRSVRSRLRPAKARRSGRPERGTPTIPPAARGTRGARRRLGPLLLLASASACSAGIYCASWSSLRPPAKGFLSTKFGKPRPSGSTTRRSLSTRSATRSLQPVRAPKVPSSANPVAENLRPPQQNRKNIPKRKSRSRWRRSRQRRQKRSAAGGGDRRQSAPGRRCHGHIGGSEKVAEGAGVKVAPVEARAQTSIGGGSSPVVPILIAVFVLAAISIGLALLQPSQLDDGLKGSPAQPDQTTPYDSRDLVDARKNSCNRRLHRNVGTPGRFGPGGTRQEHPRHTDAVGLGHAQLDRTGPER